MAHTPVVRLMDAQITRLETRFCRVTFAMPRFVVRDEWQLHDDDEEEAEL